MAIIQSFGEMEQLTPAWYQGRRYSSIRLYNQINYEYYTLYRVQPNVRTCVDFIARNIAQLNLNQFQRVSDTDRVRLTDFGMTRVINRPLPSRYKTTRYRMFESVMSDLGIYLNAYLLKIRDDQGRVIGLLRIPPQYIYPEGGLVVKNYVLSVGGYKNDIDPDDLIHFRGYNPENTTEGLSPLETLRRVLAEEDSAGRYREESWQNKARMAGFIERPLEAPEWSPTARGRFLQEFNDLYAGEGAGNSGKTAVLEEGMKWVNASYSAREAEYLGGRKLTREECARAYHIPLPMVGILDHATLTNVREQHKQLYQDCLGPWLKSLEEDFDLQLLPEFAGEADIDLIYSEFNIMQKLAGDFEEQVKSLQSAIGRPYMTANEGRARMNLPALGGDADSLVTPLNVIAGGQASPRDSAPKAGSGGQDRQKSLSQKGYSSHNQEMRERYQEKWIQVLSGHYRRQERAIISRINPALKRQKIDLGGVWWDSERWNQELKEDLIKLNLLTALAWADLIFEQIGERPRDMAAFEARMIPYIENHAGIQAEGINRETASQVEAALKDPEPLEQVQHVFNLALTSRVIQQAISALTSIANFGAFEAARSRNLSAKTWRVNSGNPRESHADLDGVTVGIRENFPNGMRWPGDPAGGADELAGCLCSVEFS